jgi:hypothetical protein
MSLSSIATAALRAAGLSEITFKKAVKEDLTGNITVVVYSKYTTEEEIPTDSNPIWVRARSIKDDQAHLTDPETISDSTRQRKEILKSYVAYLDASSPFRGQLLNGKRWSATWDGGNTIKLITPESGEPTMSLGVTSGAMDAFSGGKVPLGNRTSQSRIQIVYAQNASMRAQVAKSPHYKNFLDAFISKLSQTAFSQTSITVNSMFRTTTDQARAMVRTRFFGNQKTYNSFYSWFKTTYGTGSSKAKQIKAVIEANRLSTGAQMEAAIKARLDLQVKSGVYLSGHMKNGAFDLHTGSLPFQDVILMLEVLETMKKTHVSYLNWEGVWDYKPHSKAAKNKQLGLQTRKTKGRINNEHIHLNVIKTGAAAE